jgi:hypothetical protein
MSADWWRMRHHTGRATPRETIALTLIMLALMAISYYVLSGFASIALAIVAFGGFWAGLSYFAGRERA